MMRTGTLALVALLAATLVGACSGKSDSDDGHPSTPVASGDFADRFASTYCSSIAGCCQRFAEPYDAGSCESAVFGYISAAVNRELASGKVVFDDMEAGKCVAAYGDALSACTDRELANQLDGACENIFHGTVEIGGACADSDECIDPSGTTATCDTGVCVANEPYVSGDELPPARLGEACSATCTSEGNGTSCSGTPYPGGSPPPDSSLAACWTNDGLICGDSGTCETAPGVGDPCVSYECGVNAYCSGTVCVAASATGPCLSDGECTSTSYCDYTLGQCTPLKADGELCDSGDECAGGDCEGDRCRVWSVASSDACAGLLD